MLIRAVSADLWDRVEQYCRATGLKRREFLERSIDVLEGVDSEELQKQENFVADVKAAKDKLKVFKDIISLRKQIDKLRTDISLLNDLGTEMNMLVELKILEDRLTERTREHIPEHDIPEDTEARKALGLTGRYAGDWYDIPADYQRDGIDTPYEPEPTARSDAIENGLGVPGLDLLEDFEPSKNVAKAELVDGDSED